MAVAAMEHATKLDLKDGGSSGAVLVPQGEHETELDLISTIRYEGAGVSRSSPMKDEKG